MKIVSFIISIGLPADTLEGHRDRFLKQFRTLKEFFRRSGNLTYFRRLIQVPNLPQVRAYVKGQNVSKETDMVQCWT